MSIENYSEAQLKEMAMIEIAFEILTEKNSPKDYHSLLKEVAGLRGLTEEQMKSRIANLYTEMSVDGRFVNLGANQWGLRSWYPFDQTEEELSQTNKPRKKKGKVEEDDEDSLFDDEEDFDEFEDLEDELDELANEEDDEFDKDDDDDDEEEIDEDFEDELDSEETEDEDKFL